MFLLKSMDFCFLEESFFGFGMELGSRVCDYFVKIIVFIFSIFGIYLGMIEGVWVVS